MIKIRKSCFETNSSSTHALIVSNEDFYNWQVQENKEALACFNLKEDISIFTGEPEDKANNDIEYNVYDGTFTDVKDKLRYLYTVLVQSNLYIKDDYENIIINEESDAYSIFKDLKELFPNVNFIVPENGYDYVFEDCEYLPEEIVKSECLTTLRGLVLFFLKGRVQYCDRDDDTNISDSLYDEVKKNSLCSVICSG